MSKAAHVIVVAAVCLLMVSTAVATSNLPPPVNVRVTYYPELNNEEQVFICPVDSNVVIANWRDFRLGYRQIGIGRSTDGGQTWVDSLISVDMQYFGAEARQSDPTMTVDRLGNYYMSVLDYDGVGETDGSVISFYKSVDKGVSWTGPVPNVTVLDPIIFEDKQFITVDRTGGPYDGNVYCSWTRFPNPNRIMFVRSTDGCLSFEDTVLIGPAQSSTGCGSQILDAGQFSIPIVGSNGDVHVFWQGYVLDSGLECSGRTHIKHAVSTDGGLTFSAEQAVIPVSGYTYASGQIDTYSMPVGDVDITGGPFDGNIYIAFTNRGDEDLSEDRTDVDFIRSTDGGVTWSDRYQINDPPDAAEMDAFHPWLIVNEEGVLVVIFYDQRYDPRRYFLFDCIAAYSFDGGETFTTNHRISDVSSSPQDLDAPLDPLPPAFFSATDGGAATVATSTSMAGLIAEYIGITAFQDKILGVWTDSRDLNSEVYTATWQLPLLEPRLIAPDTNSVHSTQPLLKWSTGWKHDQDSYRVEMSPTDDFSASVISATTDTNFYLPAPPLTNGDWYWRVKAFNLTTGDSSGYSSVWNFTMEGSYECGDVDGSGQVDALDVDFFIDWLYRGGPGPVTLAVADVNGDDSVDVLDIDYFIDWLYRSGPDLNCW